MGGGLRGATDQGRAPIALIAVTAGEGELVADCCIATSITAGQKSEIARKLREIAEDVESIGGGRRPTTS